MWVVVVVMVGGAEEIKLAGVRAELGNIHLTLALCGFYLPRFCHTNYYQRNF